MQFFIHRYFLKRKTPSNAQTNDLVQAGALLKIVDDVQVFGVADICPWPTLGDQNLDAELQTRGPLFLRALELAKQDLMARKNKIKLNSGKVVKNHFLIPNYSSVNESSYGHTVKIKGHRDVTSLADFLHKNAFRFKSIRLDFNSCLTADLYDQFLSKLSQDVKNKIECVEDPYPFDEVRWKTSALTLASDFEKAPGWPVRVQKPVRTAVDQDSLYLTSAMDHPIGVVHGLIEAQKHPQKTHGFMTLDQYEESPFLKYFNILNGEMSFDSDGFGIGFETELNNLNWEPLIDFRGRSENHILYSLSLSVSDKNKLEQLKAYFETNINLMGYFLIPSSGSSVSSDHSLKLYAILKPSFMNSAQRVNEKFNLTEEMTWGSVLPSHHVGGLSILARAYLMQAKVYFSSWKSFNVEWLIENNIQLLSLVPTQLFDLVQARMKCPPNMKYVFVGGAHLSPELEKSVRELGWPLVITFGMTETSSMMAERLPHQEGYRPFPGVEIGQTTDGKLKIKSNSLAEYCLQIVQDKIIQKNLITKTGFYESEDLVEIKDDQFKFVNKSNDQIKINGEGVSLFQLRQKLESVLLSQELNPNSCALIAITDARQGESLMIVFAPIVTYSISDVIDQFNLSVLPYEKVLKTHTLQKPFPMTELNKIQFTQLKEMVLNEKV
ncbi:MAG: AMP-binding protein [Bdellovibrionaceae bacterium]|nr:AMP-binding protein [Pseudobdellovibrionaceae bacterium]